MSAGVSALRGPAPALRSATPDERRPVRSLRPSGPQLPFAFARGVTFLALATFGALHWMAMLEPTASERAWYAVGTGALAMGGLLGAARLASRALRWLAVAAVTARRARARLPRRRHRRRAAAARPAGTRWPRASRAASTRCPARACPTAASTSGRGS